MSFPSPLITVAIPAYNHAQHVKQALDSVLNSGLKALELIVCDDASTDETPSIIREWEKDHAKEFNRFLFIEKKTNSGLCASMNQIIDASQGEIIHILASDDFYLPGGLLIKTQAMMDNPMWDAAFCDAQAVGVDGRVYEPSLLAASRINPACLHPGLMMEELLYHWDMPVSLQSWRRSAFKSHGGGFEYDATVFCEDLDGAWWAMARKSFGFISNICQGYRCRSWPQTSDRNHTRELRDMAYVLARNAQYFEPHIAQAMRNFSDALFHTAIGETETAALHWNRHHNNEAIYQIRAGNPQSTTGELVSPLPHPPDEVRVCTCPASSVIEERIALLEQGMAHLKLKLTDERLRSEKWKKKHQACQLQMQGLRNHRLIRLLKKAHLIDTTI